MYLAFIHIGRYDIKARRHLACVQNGITQLGDWRMETWQLALRARCHVSIRQSPSLCNAILNTCPCLLAINPNVYMHTFAPLSTVIAPYQDTLFLIWTQGLKYHSWFLAPLAYTDFRDFQFCDKRNTIHLYVTVHIVFICYIIYLSIKKLEI